MDGDARGGAAISVRSVTGIPIKFLGTGEKLDALEKFDPTRLASRILGMGDMLGLIERAQATWDAQVSTGQGERLAAGNFTLEDWLQQVQQVKKMGSVSQIMEMLPGNLGKHAAHADPQEAQGNLQASEAIIRSMTQPERRKPEILDASRRRRIARGSGTSVQQVNRLLKQFREVQKLMSTMQKSGSRGMRDLLG
jgi:signal recognition particle subunit SRP54